MLFLLNSVANFPNTLWNLFHLYIIKIGFSLWNSHYLFEIRKWKFRMNIAGRKKWQVNLLLSHLSISLSLLTLSHSLLSLSLTLSLSVSIVVQPIVVLICLIHLAWNLDPSIYPIFLIPSSFENRLRNIFQKILKMSISYCEIIKIG